jgi:hypothetical protein
VHPPAQYFTWHAYNVITHKKDWLCIICNACHAVLKGSHAEYEAYVRRHGG